MARPRPEITVEAQGELRRIFAALQAHADDLYQMDQIRLAEMARQNRPFTAGESVWIRGMVGECRQRGIDVMAKRAKKSYTGEQMDLIDVTPENQKAILKAVKAYKAATDAVAEEKKAQHNCLLRLCEKIVDANIQPNNDGDFEFTVGDFKIKVTPAEDKIKIAAAKPKANEEPIDADA